MTQEEKAKAYDEAIERAKNFIENGDEGERTVAESIFAGLMEVSEDEKIRKELLNAFQESEDSLYMLLTPHRRESFIAWLEKQGEQKESYDTCVSTPLNDKKTPYGEKRDFGYFKKQREQKSAEWTHKDGKNLAELWEKDLVSYKRQEWSEEDEEKINEIIDYLDYKGHKTDVEFLKSLKERYTWKPSKEQIMVLAKASETYCGIDKGVLYSLYNDLKKLREE